MPEKEKIILRAIGHIVNLNEHILKDDNLRTNIKKSMVWLEEQARKDERGKIFAILNELDESGGDLVYEVVKELLERKEGVDRSEM